MSLPGNQPGILSTPEPGDLVETEWRCPHCGEEHTCWIVWPEDKLEAETDGCPNCGELRCRKLVWNEELTRAKCKTCGTTYHLITGIEE